MRVLAPILMLCLVLSSPGALAQEGSEAALIDRVSSLRLEIERFTDAMRELNRQQAGLNGNLDELAEQIRKRKAGRSEGGLIPDFALETLLRRSQQLSSSLTLLNKEVEALRSVRGERLRRLAEVYSRLVQETAKSIRKASGERQTELLATLKRLHAEREKIRTEIAPPHMPPPPMETDNLLASEDPEELTERADAVRDEQDRLRVRLVRVDKRIGDLRADRRLAQEMRDFQADQDLFAEDQRFLQAKATSTAPSSNSYTFGDRSSKDGDGLQGEPAPDTEPDDSRDLDDGADPGLNPGGECAGGACGTPDESGGGSFEPGPVTVTETTETTRIREGTMPVGVDPTDAELDRMSPAERLRLLRRQRATIIRQIKKLQILHDRIQEKAEGLEDE